MKPRVVFSILAIVVVAGVALVTNGRSSAAVPATSPDWAGIDRYVQSQVDANHVPGVALAVVEGDSIVHFCGFGRADNSGRAVNSDTPFMIGSNTKTFTALAIMQLAEAGRLDLDAPVQRYVPQFELADLEASRTITVRQLLNHTSGIPDGAGGGVPEGMTQATPEEGLASIRNVQLTAQPGTMFQYSNAGYMVLGLVAQNASGERYVDYIQQHILDPLGMRHTYLTLDAAKQNGMASGYRYWFGVPVAQDWRYGPALVSAGGVISTTDDMARYLSMYLNNGSYQGQTLLSPAGIAAMETPSINAASSQIGETVKLDFGLGWAIGDLNGVPAVYHTGGTPNFASWIILLPGDNRAIVVLTNADNFIPGGSGPDAFGIPIAVTSLLAGRPLKAEGLTMSRLYLYVDLAALLLLGVQVWSLVRLLRRPLKAARRPKGIRRTLAQFRQSVLPLLWEIGLSGYFVLGLPALLKSPDWDWLFVWLPDVSLVVWFFCGLWFATGITRITRATRARTRTGVPNQRLDTRSGGAHPVGAPTPLH